MLILVAVTVRTVIQSGLFRHAGKATSGYSMHQAREQLGTTLAGAQAEKYTNKDYNETDYLNQYIIDNLPGTKVEGDIAIVDGWAFELDRSVPKIGQDLGKEGTFTYPDLKLEKGTLAEDKLSIPIKIIAKEAENGISKIEVILNGKVVKTFDDCNNSIEELTRTYTATENGNYSVKVYSKINRTGYITVDEIVPPTPQIGEYVRYTPDQAEDYLMEAKYNGYGDQTIPQDTTLRWKVMNYNDDGIIELIADKPINTTVSFRGVLGFNNGVYLLNDLCKSQYSNNSLGAVGRSINLQDIESEMNGAGLSARDNYSGYNSRQTYYQATKTPDIYKYTDKTTAGESSSYYSFPTTETYIRETTLSTKYTNYNVGQQESYYNESFYNLIFKNEWKYFLASRCTICLDSTYAEFGLRYVVSNHIQGLPIAYSNDFEGNSCSATVRPVIKLIEPCKLQQVEGTNEWEIVKK